LWNKRPDEGPTQRPQPQLQPQSQTRYEPTQTGPQAQTPPPPRFEPPVARQVATIGSAMHIKGDIRAQEELMVDGDVEGSLESQSILTVGQNGKVKANIKAREVHIFGKVHGNVEVSGKIAIREQGSLVGDIKAAGISIDDGAYFKGSIDIIRPEPKVTTMAVKTEAKVEAHAV
jgi:cytoskeletal protein CcmA (bactofilin family)